MSIITDNIRSNTRERQLQRTNLRKAQFIKGVCCNFRGIISGVSLHRNGNFSYVGLGGSVDADGNQTFTRVVSAAIQVPLTTFQPGDNVVLRYDDELKRHYIVGVDAETFEATGASVQKNNPANPSNIFIDPARLSHFLARPQVSQAGTLSTNVIVYPGQVVYNGEPVFYNGGLTDLSSFAPSAGNHLVAQLWFDPVNNAIEVTTSTAQATSSAIADSDYEEAFASANNEWYALQSYILTSNAANVITEADLGRDNRMLYEPKRASGTLGYPNPVTVDTTIPDGNTLIVADSLSISSGASLSIGSGSVLQVIDTRPSNYQTVRTVTSDATVLPSDARVYVDASSNTVTVTLPNANTVSGLEVNIKAIDTTNAVTITSVSTIDNSASDIVMSLYESITLHSDGSEWWVI